jgi:hypothetical protein
MHRDHDHTRDDHARHRDPADDRHAHDHSHHVGPGHNHAHGPQGVAQWQTPHLERHERQAPAGGEPDLDKVEAAFIEGFLGASDPTSFLRLAGVPFNATGTDGTALSLLRVETEVVADVGSVTPHLGGGSFRYDPLPSQLVSRRRRARFVYFDGAGLRALDFAQVRGVRPSGSDA